MKLKKIILIFIVILAFFLRFYKLGQLPNSYTPDEVAQGYSAYSILKTGKDEWNSSNIFSLRSFGDYKPPFQTWLMIPSIKIFGLNTFAIRFPNALLAVLTVVLVFFLTQQIFKNCWVSILSTFLMAISPWHVAISRIALEANVLVFLVVLSTFLFLKYIQNNNRFYLLFSSVFFGFGLLAYHSAKIFIPLLILLIIWYSRIYLKPAKIIIFLFIFTFFLTAGFFISKNSRTSDIAIFNPTDKWASVSDQRFESTSNGLPDIISRFFNNKITYVLFNFSRSYSSYFSPHFLLFNGPGETTYGMIPDFGVIGIVPFIGILYSLIILIKSDSKYKRQIIFLIIAILISPIAAGLSKGSFAANRVSVMMPFLQILCAFGLISLLNLKFKFKKFIIIIFGLLFLFDTLHFFEKYFFQGNKILAEGMLSGRKESIDFIKGFPVNTNIIYSRKLSEPQSYVSFFYPIDPIDTQKYSPSWLKYDQEKLSFLDQLGEYRLKNFTFKEINFPSDSLLPNTILIGKPEEFPGNIKPDKIINYPNNTASKPSIFIYINKQ